MQMQNCDLFSLTGWEVCLGENTWRHPLTAESFPLSHFTHFTHSDLLLVCLIQSWVHRDLSRITGVLFGQNKAEYSTPCACPLAKTGERLLKGYFKQCLKVTIHGELRSLKTLMIWPLSQKLRKKKVKSWICCQFTCIWINICNTL